MKKINTIHGLYKEYIVSDYCKTHPKYKAIRKPTADCEKCRTIWYSKEKEKI